MYGNHELDHGTNEFASMIAAETRDSKICPGAMIPCLSSHLGLGADDNLAGQVFQRTIDVAEGDAESVAMELNGVIGREGIGNSAENAVPDAPAQRRNRPEDSARTPSSDEARMNLLRYRRECYQEMTRGGRRAFYIVNDETIERIVAQRPANLRQLETIQGVPPSTLERHGDAILRIVRGEG